MTSFGTAVAGVGTLHAPLAAGGCAAILQATSATLVSVKAAAFGGVAGGAVGAAVSYLKTHLSVQLCHSG
jgi:hypothetical protein